MATEVQLRRRIRELQSEIESLRHQQSTFQADFVKKMNEQMRHFKQEYEIALKRQKDETEEIYAKRLREFQEEMAQQKQRSYQKLQEDTQRIVNQQTEKITELSACNEELRELLKKMKAHTQETAQVHQSIAKELLKEVEQSKSVVAKSPHEFFFQGEFEIIDSHAKQISDEIEKEMFQSATSDANSVIMEFDLLKVKVEQALHEWMLAFADYCRIVRELETKIHILENHSIQTSVGTFQMKEAELNFWSSGTYLPFKQKLKNALHVIAEIEDAGIVSYLKEQKTANRKGIFAQVYEVQKWNDELFGITNCILNERMFSDERWKLAQTVEKQLYLAGYHKRKKGFREPEPNLKKSSWYPQGRKYLQNPLESFELIEIMQDADFVSILFVPVREHGVSVRNECIVSVMAHTLKDRDFIREIMQANVNRIRAVVGSVRVIGIDAECEKNQVLHLEEQRRKKIPNPAEQIKHLERKYH